jgi:hypothetical protein
MLQSHSFDLQMWREDLKNPLDGFRYEIAEPIRDEKMLE